MALQPLIDILNIWDEAVKHFDQGEWRKSILKFDEITVKSSRHLYNVACCHIQLGQFVDAIQILNLTLSKDAHLVIALAQRAQCNHHLKKYDEACTDLKKAMTLIGTRSFISYQPMGLNHKLNNIEVTYNLAAVYSAASDWDSSRQWLIKAGERETRLGLAHIGNALRDIQQHKAFEPLSLPTSAIFHPDKSMLANVAKKNYLGQAKVIADVRATEAKDDSTLRSNRLTVLHADCRTRSKSSDSILEAASRPAFRGATVQLSSRALRQLHREMPRAPPPRLVKKNGTKGGIPDQEQDVRLYPLPPPPPLRKNELSKRSEEVRARKPGLDNDWSDFDTMDETFSKTKNGISPALRVDNDPWRSADESQMSELESALKKQRSKLVGRTE